MNFEVNNTTPNEAILINDVLQPTDKIQLTELEDTYNEDSWCCASRFGRNMVRVSIAGILSACGAWYAGFVPNTWGIVFGSAVAGIGNGASTGLAWEMKRRGLIEARMVKDFPKVLSKVDLICKNLFDLNEKMNFRENEIVEPEVSLTFLNKIKDYATWFFTKRHIRNAVRLFSAGSFSAAGGYLGGFLTTPGGIIGGGILGGFGNALSTWLAYEQINDAEIRKKALKELPKVLKDVEECELRLQSVINRIQALDPNFRMNFEVCSPPQSAECGEEESDEESWERYKRNFWYINVAGWISCGGGLLAGFYPKPAGIVLGGTLGALANAISTWLAWENKNDLRVERNAIEKFPLLIKKIEDISKHILSLENYADSLEMVGKMNASSFDTVVDL